MTEIQILRESGRDLVKNHDHFPHEEGSEPPQKELQSHIKSIEVEDEDVNLDFDRLEFVINHAKVLFDVGRDEQRTAMDSNLAPVVRECLQIPPRVAAIPGFWWHTTLLRYPDFIMTRWSRDDDLTEKFLGTQKDLYSNHMARLWWGAHLTRNEDTGDYFATHRLFNKQRQVNYLLDSAFRRYRPAARAFAIELWDEKGTDVDEIAKRFNDSLSTIQLESRSEEDLGEQLEKIREVVL